MLPCRGFARTRSCSLSLAGSSHLFDDSAFFCVVRVFNAQGDFLNSILDEMEDIVDYARTYLRLGVIATARNGISCTLHLIQLIGPTYCW